MATHIESSWQHFKYTNRCVYIALGEPFEMLPRMQFWIFWMWCLWNVLHNLMVCSAKKGYTQCETSELYPNIPRRKWTRYITPHTNVFTETFGKGFTIMTRAASFTELSTLREKKIVYLACPMNDPDIHYRSQPNVLFF